MTLLPLTVTGDEVLLLLYGMHISNSSEAVMSLTLSCLTAGNPPVLQVNMSDCSGLHVQLNHVPSCGVLCLALIVSLTEFTCSSLSSLPFLYSCFNSQHELLHILPTQALCHLDGKWLAHIDDWNTDFHWHYKWMMIVSRRLELWINLELEHV